MMLWCKYCYQSEVQWFNNLSYVTRPTIRAWSHSAVHKTLASYKCSGISMFLSNLMTSSIQLNYHNQFYFYYCCDLQKSNFLVEVFAYRDKLAESS